MPLAVLLWITFNCSLLVVWCRFLLFTPELRPKTGRVRRNPTDLALLTKEAQGLPPLLLKESNVGLSVTERTFSAPALPFIDPSYELTPLVSLQRRPGSSGSQVVARSKREHNPATRNDLIDKDILRSHLEQHAETRLTRVRDSASDDGNVYDGMRRKESFTTDSTDVGVNDDEKTVTSESLDDPSKKPRWHPPWQLKQVTLSLDTPRVVIWKPCSFFWMAVIPRRALAYPQAQRYAVGTSCCSVFYSCELRSMSPSLRVLIRVYAL